MVKNDAPDFRSWAMLIGVSLVWGSSFILMKRGLVVFNPQQVASMRIFFAMLCLLPVLPRSLKIVKRKEILPIIGVAVVGSGIPAFLFTIAQTQIDSAAAGVLNSLTPLSTLLLGIVFFGARLRRNTLLGILLGLVGAGLLIVLKTDGQLSSNSNYWYGLFIVLATIGYGTSVNLVKHYCQNIPAISINALAFAIIGPWVGIYLFSSDFLYKLQHVPGAWVALQYVAILAVFGTAVANIIFFRLTQRTTAVFASTVTYLIPIVAVLWGVIDNEAIDYSYLVGMSLILGGIYLSSRM